MPETCLIMSQKKNSLLWFTTVCTIITLIVISEISEVRIYIIINTIMMMHKNIIKNTI